jgi:hypothetical protein
MPNLVAFRAPSPCLRRTPASISLMSAGVGSLFSCHVARWSLPPMVHVSLSGILSS